MQNLPKLRSQYKILKPKIEQRLLEFKKVKKQDYFYEAAFCILTPQSQARKCWQAIQQLKELDFQNKNVNPLPILQTKTRFHNHKSQYLHQLKTNWSNIIQSHNEIKDNKQLRNHLAENVKGWGLKESSHYLRNIGYTNLAILDRHILKNLHKHQVIKELPKVLTKQKYFQIENKFEHFSKQINIPQDHLDLLFWAQETGEIFK